MPTATVSHKARSPWVKGIMSVVDRKSWTSNEDIYRAAAKYVPRGQALKVFKLRLSHLTGLSKAQQIKRGRAMQIMLATITLVQSGKLEQRGRGPTKEFRLK